MSRCPTCGTRWPINADGTCPGCEPIEADALGDGWSGGIDSMVSIAVMLAALGAAGATAVVLLAQTFGG